MPPAPPSSTRPGTLCLTFDNMGRAREIGEGLASRPDEDEPGLAVGYPRILTLLDELELKATFFIEGWNALHHPRRVEELAQRGHEVGLHGWVHEKFGSLDKRRAEQLLYDGTAALERIGLRPQGFRAPGALRGEHTVPILRELGFLYDSSTDPRDSSAQPALLAPGLAHVPWRDEMVDSIQYLRHPVRARTPDEMEALWRAGIDGAAERGETVTMVAHAFVSGVDDARFAALRNVLAYARNRLQTVTAQIVGERVLGGDR
jgi:peptidoglycan/xylan/chitin deacetylase (PgdA/CDA1 family)